ncbi:Glucanosyltransferase-domain-containing protein [Dimargaris cristalligena]|uniref:1,3-beta-glucanosyltransferase n=1 Tax=Dimargaris cristalligena TaxID=215637 RepID=A0A4P9ZTC9_9FUNG|nr:Glucanosyltransferase-domain-containing protein [Dimargaris cristalligena]|eukprot:RKP36091.1 Glucanosyltransferase-domain-containing protein [Dimargaris cristalligena]
MKVTTSLLCLALGTLVSQVSALDPIVTVGSKFFNSKTGEQFYVKGIAYQPGAGKTNTTDPLADTTACKRDIARFKDLGLNVVRVYEVQNENNHDECMKALEAAGIYLLLDVSTAKQSINRNEPEYTLEMYNYVATKMGKFTKYSNMFGFIAGNEVSNEPSNTDASPFVKALLRDMKALLKASNLSIPVGYATNDDEAIRDPLQDFFACGDTTVRADFYGVNIYQWCGSKTDFVTSGYKDTMERYKDYVIPSYLTEYGCNINRPRTFDEVASIYGPDMQDIMSGGVVYEYSEESNEYGLVEIKDGKDTPNQDYANFKKAISAVEPKGTTMSSYKADDKTLKCPSSSSSWTASEKLPPTPSNQTCKCLQDTYSCQLTIAPSGDDDKTFGSAVGDILGVICDAIDCGPISADGANGTYGAFSFCDATTKTNWALSAYAASGKGGDKACDFDGKAKTNTPKVKDASTCGNKTDSTVKLSGSGSGGSSSSSDNNDSTSAAPRLFGVNHKGLP